VTKKLWPDDKIKSLTVLAANTVDPDARWMHEQIAKDMRDDYERALAFRNEDIGRLQGEVKTQVGCIAELERQVKELNVLLAKSDVASIAVGGQQGELWEPVTADEKHEQEGKEILIENQGAWVGIRRIGVEGRDAWHGVWLNELGCIVMRRVQP